MARNFKVVDRVSPMLFPPDLKDWLDSRGQAILVSPLILRQPRMIETRSLAGKIQKTRQERLAKALDSRGQAILVSPLILRQPRMIETRSLAGKIQKTRQERLAKALDASKLMHLLV